METIPFVKMHGAGNDFVIFDGRTRSLPDVTRAFSQRLADRRLGIGCDQLVIIRQANDPTAIARVEFRNADGSSAEMCGNGIRCVGAHLLAAEPIPTPFRLETEQRIVSIDRHDGILSVDMGQPRFQPAEIPTTLSGDMIQQSLKLSDGTAIDCSLISMGNPHCVAFVDSRARLAMATSHGPLVEIAPHFPRRINSEWAYVADRKTIISRVWERGAGETLACGSGACAIGVAALSRGLVDSPVAIDMPGGRLSVTWHPGSTVQLSGPTAHVFSGNYLMIQD